MQLTLLQSAESEERYSEEAETRWIKKNSPFVARFLTLNLNSNLSALFPDLVPEFGRFSLILSSDSALEKYLMRSPSDLMDTLRNIALLLKSGGFFAGFVVDSSEFWNRAIHVTNAQLSSKPSFSAASNLIKIEMKKMASFTGLEPSQTAPHPQETFEEWLSSNPATVGLEYTLTTSEGAATLSNEMFVVHVPTFVNAAALVGLKCISFRNMVEFYDTFKGREEEQLRKMQVITKHAPKVLPDQKDAASLYSVFVFQKV